MDLLVLAAVLLSAFLHALWNAFLKKQPEPEVAAAAVILVCAAAAVLVALVSPGPAFPTLASGLWSGLAGAFEAVYIIALSRALTRAPLGPVYTISRGGALLFVWPISVAFLDERLTIAVAAGTILVALGLVVTSGLRGAERTPRAAVLLALVAASGIAGYHLCYKQALAAGGVPTVVFAVSMAVAVPLNLARLGGLARRRLRAIVRGRPLAYLASGLVAAASFLVFLHALEHAGAGAVFTLRNTSIFFAQAMSWALGERPTLRGAAGAAAVVGGAILLSI